jgi:membrane-associated HD superfamily phosphohydrolase
MSRFEEIRESDEESSQQSTEEKTETATDTENTTNEETPPDVPYNQPPQHPIHVPDHYWDDYRDSINFEVKRMLAQEFDVRNPKFYEMNTATIRLAAANPEAIAKLILDERGIDVDLSDIGEGGL